MENQYVWLDSVEGEVFHGSVAKYTQFGIVPLTPEERAQLVGMLNEHPELKKHIAELEKELKVANGHLDELTEGVNFVACTPLGGK